ncbi:MAG: hypothetical protein EHM39_03645 [Chloroflexi bacterium]|nr:MAG: hypothetical protein EHM39_03645 [Chloroflexota bacterium]
MEAVVEQANSITTRPYVLEQRPVMDIIRGQLLKQRLIMGALSFLVVYAIWTAQNNRGSDQPDYVCISWIVIFFVGLQFFGFFNSVNNYRNALTEAGWFTVPRWNQIDDRFFVIAIQDSNFSKAALDGLFKEMRLHNGYCVLKYASGKQMTFIPANAFESPDDRRRFEDLLASKGVKIARKDG